jgi:hypothetical protein
VTVYKYELFAAAWAAAFFEPLELYSHAFHDIAMKFL